VPGRTDRRDALDLGGSTDSQQELVHREIPGDMEAGLDPGARHRGDVVRDLLAGEIELAGRRGTVRSVLVGRPKRGGAGAERPVDIEVAADPGQTRYLLEELARVVDGHAQLGTVPDHRRQTSLGPLGHLQQRA